MKVPICVLRDSGDVAPVCKHVHTSDIEDVVHVLDCANMRYWRSDMCVLYLYIGDTGGGGLMYFAHVY